MTLTDKLIFDTAVSDGMPQTLATIIIGQARLESGNYLHKFFTTGKNAFGYMYDKNSRWQIAPGGLADNKFKIAQYKSVTDSVHELTDWIKRRQKDGQFPKDLNTIKTPLSYSTYLRTGAHVYGGRNTKEYTDGIAARLKLIGIDITKGTGGNAAPLIIGLLLVTLLFIK